MHEKFYCTLHKENKEWVGSCNERLNSENVLRVQNTGHLRRAKGFHIQAAFHRCGATSLHLKGLSQNSWNESSYSEDLSPRSCTEFRAHCTHGWRATRVQIQKIEECSRVGITAPALAREERIGSVPIHVHIETFRRVSKIDQANIVYV